MTWWVAAALAQTPVIHQDVPAGDALAIVVERTGLPRSQLASAPLDALLAAPPSPVGDAALRRCAHDPVDGEAVRAAVARIDAAWAEGDRAAVRDRLDRAVRQVGCLSDVVEGAVAARIFLLRGALATDEGDAEMAAQELVTARALHPGADWPDDLPEAGRALWEADAPDPSATVSTRPARQPSGPWLDGRRVDASVQVPPGLHLLQFAGAPGGLASGWLSVGGHTTVVFPHAFPPSVLAGMGTEEGNLEVVSLLAGARPGLDAAYVVDGGLWLVTREGGGLAVTELSPRPEPEPELTPRERRKQERAARREARKAAREK